MSKILNDKYRLQNVLGVGAFGEVRCASIVPRRRSPNGSANQYCAIKIIDQRIVQAKKEQLEFELNILPELSHPHVIRVHEVSAGKLYGQYCLECGCTDFHSSGGRGDRCRNCPHDSSSHCKLRQARPVTLIVQELCAAGDLFVLLVRSGAFPEDLSRLYFKELVLGIEFLHLNGIIHKDIKPENLCFDANFRLKIIDFGSAASSQEIGFRLEYEEQYESVDNRKRCIETQIYSAPEICVLKGAGCCASDVWSSGVVLFVLLMGKPPWRRPVSEGRHRDKYFIDILQGFYPNKLPESVTDLLIKIWSLQPANRLTIEEVKKTEFWDGPVPNKESVERQMLERTRMAWIGEAQPEMLRVLNVMREQQPEPGYPQFERRSPSPSPVPLSIPPHSPSPSPMLPPTSKRRPDTGDERYGNHELGPASSETSHIQALFEQVDKEPSAGIQDEEPHCIDYKQNFQFTQELEIDLLTPCTPGFIQEEMGSSHARLAKKIVARLKSWRPNLKVDVIERLKTTRLEVVSTETPEFEAQILVSDDQGELLSIRGEGSRDPTLENDLERLLIL